MNNEMHGEDPKWLFSEVTILKKQTNSYAWGPKLPLERGLIFTTGKTD